MLRWDRYTHVSNGNLHIANARIVSLELSTMFSTTRFLAIPVLAMGLVTSAASAQANPVSTLAGSVQDPTGAAIPGAAVTVTNVETGAKRTDSSGTSGAYSFNALPAGHYKLEVSKDGFKSYSQTIELQVNSNPSIVVPLEIGATSETVEVTGSSALVETQSVGVGQVVDQQQIVDLPLNGRNPTQLITLSGASVQAPVSNGGVQSNLNYPTAAAFSLAGGQANATNYFLDGAPNMDIRTNVGLPLPFPDALDQFKVESSALAANYGSLPGGAVNAVTRSGTNRFHGTVFEFIRNGAVNAQNHFYNPKSGAPDSLKRNQFGFTIGGPVKKDKLFFFAGLQMTRERANPFFTTILPTTAARSGDLRTMLSTACRSTAITVNPTYTTSTNVLNPSLLSKVSQNLLKYLPTPTDDVCGNTNITRPQFDNEYQGVARVDFQRTSNDSINFRYFVSDYFLKPQFANNNVLSASGPGLKDRVTSIELGDTHLINSNLVNSLRLFYARSAIQRVNADGTPTTASLGINAYSPTPNFFGQWTISGYFTPGNFPGYVYSNTLGLANDITWTKGKHTVIGGFYFIRPSMFGDGLFQTNGNPVFDGSISASAMADFLVGRAATWTQGNGQIGNDWVNIPSLYVQDNWKATKKLQINAGIRWDPLIPQSSKYGYVSDFSLAGLAAGTKSKTFLNAPAGLSFMGDPGVNGRSDYNSRYGNFAPRVGIVFSPRGDGREVIRAGYGLFWSGAYLWQALHIPLNAPWGNTTVVRNVDIASPFGANNPFPTATPTANVAFPAATSYVFFPNNLRAMNVQQYNIAYERQIGNSASISASYLGNYTMHQALGQELNSATYIPGTSTGAVAGSCGFLGTNAPAAVGAACSSTGNTQARRNFTTINATAAPFYGSTIQENDTFSGNYNGLLVSAKYRTRTGLNILANYTYSKCLNYGDANQDITNQFQNPNNTGAEYGPCNLDRRNLVNVSVVGNSPKFDQPVVRALFTGWTGSVIYTYSSGAPFTMLTGTDRSLTGVGSDRPATIGDPHAVTNRGVSNWFNIAAFQAQTVGTFGNTSRNSLTGPSIWNADMGLWRSFGYRDKARLELRFEAFNVLNHTRLMSPTSTLTSANNGKITTAYDPRILQAAAKISF
jgi:hypothetical protein